MFVAIRERLEKDEDGFTLIELLVVVIIIGILAAIAIPTFLNQRQRGWQAEMTSTLRNVALEVEAAGTAAGGSYAAVTEAVVDGFAAGIQGAAADPTILTLGNASATEFCIIATHTQLGTANLVYESDAGGVGTFSAAGTAACVD